MELEELKKINSNLVGIVTAIWLILGVLIAIAWKM